MVATVPLEPDQCGRQVLRGRGACLPAGDRRDLLRAEQVQRQVELVDAVAHGGAAPSASFSRCRARAGPSSCQAGTTGCRTGPPGGRPNSGPPIGCCAAAAASPKQCWNTQEAGAARLRLLNQSKSARLNAGGFSESTWTPASRHSSVAQSICTAWAGCTGARCRPCLRQESPRGQVPAGNTVSVRELVSGPGPRRKRPRARHDRLCGPGCPRERPRCRRFLRWPLCTSACSLRLCSVRLLQRGVRGAP